jgi:hypothetical protein
MTDIRHKPLCRNPRTLTTTFTFPPGVIFPAGGTMTATGVFDLNEGLEAVDMSGVLARSSLAKVRAGAMASLNRSMQSSTTS